MQGNGCLGKGLCWHEWLVCLEIDNDLSGCGTKPYHGLCKTVGASGMVGSREHAFDAGGSHCRGNVIVVGRDHHPAGTGCLGNPCHSADHWLSAEV